MRAWNTRLHRPGSEPGKGVSAEPAPDLIRGRPRYYEAVRNQLELRACDLEAVLAADHTARLVGGLVQGLDLSGPYGGIRAVEGGRGRAPIDPAILVAVWLYATLDGVGSARAAARLCVRDDPYRWLVALEQGLEATIKALRQHQRAIAALPSARVSGKLRGDCVDDLDLLAGRLGQEDFHEQAADLNTMLTGLCSRVSGAVRELAEAQKQRLAEAEADLKRIPEGTELTREEQTNALTQVAALALPVSEGLSGLEKLITQEFDIQSSLSDLKSRIIRDGRERQRQQAEEEKKKNLKEGRGRVTLTFTVPDTVSSASELEDLIRQLQALKAKLSYFEQFELKIERG